VTLLSTSGFRDWSQTSYASSGDWVSWTVNIVTAGDYRLTAKAVPDGWAAIIVDGNEIGRGSSGLNPNGIVHLDAGHHTIRVQSVGGWYNIKGLAIDRLVLGL
jgi:hypothetical protein